MGWCWENNGLTGNFDGKYLSIGCSTRQTLYFHTSRMFARLGIQCPASKGNHQYVASPHPNPKRSQLPSVQKWGCGCNDNNLYVLERFLFKDANSVAEHGSRKVATTKTRFLYSFDFKNYWNAARTTLEMKSGQATSTDMSLRLRTGAKFRIGVHEFIQIKWPEATQHVFIVMVLYSAASGKPSKEV